LQVVAQAVVDQLGFGAAVVNMVRPGDMCEAAAVAGPADVADALLGTQAPIISRRSTTHSGTRRATSCW
jgi:hypothetical protein